MSWGGENCKTFTIAGDRKDHACRSGLLESNVWGLICWVFSRTSSDYARLCHYCATWPIRLVWYTELLNSPVQRGRFSSTTTRRTLWSQFFGWWDNFFTGKPNMPNQSDGKNPWVSGEDFPQPIHWFEASTWTNHDWGAIKNPTKSSAQSASRTAASHETTARMAFFAEVGSNFAFKKILEYYRILKQRLNRYQLISTKSEVRIMLDTD